MCNVSTVKDLVLEELLQLHEKQDEMKDVKESKIELNWINDLQEAMAIVLACTNHKILENAALSHQEAEYDLQMMNQECCNLGNELEEKDNGLDKELERRHKMRFAKLKKKNILWLKRCVDWKECK